MLGKEEIENLKKTVVEKKKLIQKIKAKPAAQVTNTENKAKTSSPGMVYLLNLFCCLPTKVCEV